MVKLIPLTENDMEQFILDCQDAYTYGVQEIFSVQYQQVAKDDGQVISRGLIEKFIDEGLAYRIVKDGVNFGGLIVYIEDDIGSLDVIFVAPGENNNGIGYEAWCEVEQMLPDVKAWVAETHCFADRNIHFFVNKCGFNIFEYINSHHHEPDDTDFDADSYVPLYDDYFRMVKYIE